VEAGSASVRRIDAVDQRGQESPLSCSGQLDPALADFHGARDEPALR